MEIGYSGSIFGLLNEKRFVFKIGLITLSGVLLVSCAGGDLAGSRVELTTSVPGVEWSSEWREGGLSPESLYLLLSAEIAGQRGDYEMALDNYLIVAKQTGDPKVAERATQVALFVKEKERALTAVTLWLDSDPTSIAAKKIAALLYLRRGEWENGLVQLKALLNRPDVEFDALLVDLVKLVGAEAPEESMAIMAGLARAFPDQPLVHFNYAGVALNQMALEVALDEIRKALQLRPKWPRAKLLEAKIVLQMGNKAAAKTIIKQALALDPNDTDLQMIAARLLTKLGDFSAAGKIFTRLVRRQPDYRAAHFELALVKLQLKDAAAARKILLKLAEDSVWRDRAYLYLGYLESEEKNYDRALEWFDRVIESGGALGEEAGLSAISTAVAGNRNDEAMERLRTLRRRFPEQAVRFYLLEAELLTKQQDYQGVIDLMSEGLKALPGQSELLYTRALSAERLGRLDVLERDLKTILEEDPDDVNALNALGYTLVDQTDRYSEAQGYLDKAIQMKPDDPVIIDSYGWLQYRLGNYQKALEYLQRAYKLNRDTEIAGHLGEVLWVMGRQTDARAIWKEALKQDPDNEALLKVIMRVTGGGGS